MLRKNWKRNLSVALIGMGTLSLSSMASAEELSEEVAYLEPTEVNQEETDSGEVREVIVSATRTEMAVKDSPASVTVITRKQIEERHADNLVDVLRDIPGVYVKPTGSMAMDDNVRIRGSKSNHVLILIDGRRINGEASSTTARELERIRMDNVERVEVLKGPASALYGSDAIGGVINVITRSPGKAQLEVYANYRVLEGDGDIGNSIGAYFQSDKRGSFAWSLAAGRNYKNELSFDGKTSQYLYGEDIPVNFKGVWDVAKDQQIKLELGYLKENLDSNGLSTGMVKQVQQTRYDNKRMDYSVEYTGKKENWDWQLRYYGSEYEKNYDVYQISNGAQIGSNYAKNRSNVLEGRATVGIGEKNLFTGGFEVGQQKLEGDRILDTEQSADRFAVYFQDEWTPSDKWLIIPAVRIEKVEEFSASVTPRVGATYFAKPDLRFKASFSTGYRTPSLAERYNDWIMATMGPIQIRQVGNPDLDPEKSMAGEIGVEKDWQNHTLKVTAYRNKVKDLIEDDMDSSNPMRWVASYKNVDNAILQGIELTTTHKISREFSLNFGYSYLDAYDDDTDERLMGRAKNQITFGGTYQPVDSRWRFSLDGNYLHDYIYDDGTADGLTKSFLIANAMVNYKFGKEKQGSVYVGIENLFDKQDYKMYHFGRTYVMGVNYKF